MSAPIVTLTSDFGSGPFAGIMKGVILGICPAARLIDISHHIPPQEVREAAVVIEQAMGVFPSGTVHLAVVDPGVGTGRRAIAISALGCLFVGPDNGLFTPVLLADPRAKTVKLSNDKYFRHPVSATFHGRDVFAPVAAHLAAGVELGVLGGEVSDPVLLEWQAPHEEEGRLVGQVASVDRFGNIATTLERHRVEEFLAGRPAEIVMGPLTLKGISQAYGDVPAGAPVALYNSMDRLELALYMGDLFHRLGLNLEGVLALKVHLKAQE